MSRMADQAQADPVDLLCIIIMLIKDQVPAEDRYLNIVLTRDQVIARDPLRNNMMELMALIFNTNLIILMDKILLNNLMEVSREDLGEEERGRELGKIQMLSLSILVLLL